MSAGNGSIMRLAPVAIFHAKDAREAERAAAESSRTTHGARECVDACRLLARILVAALSGASKDTVLFSHAEMPELAPKIRAIAEGDYREKPEGEIRGSGYVVASLEAALWSFHHTDTFEAAVLRAANLGDDADTTAAVSGQVAGAFHGEGDIPAPWLERLARRDDIVSFANALVSARS